ncbi:MAG TPA: AsmA family protein [Candidatus Omnitrophota bacterium]|nr:AsmA family protein [Candidatus Omnitrophota bacterium]HRZ14743.1 AsmA family protein [Candidatus Omnitrophota bacterium]
MKILKITLISLLALVVLVALAAVIFVATFDVNRYKPQIIAQASAALGRQVNFDRARLGISLTRGISLEISDLSIAEDPAFAAGDFCTVKDISLAVDALGFILRKKVNVPGVLIDTPRITIIRQKDGSMNVMTIAKPAQPAAQPVVAATPQPGTPAALPAVLITSLQLKGGTVTYIDNSFEPAMKLAVNDLTVSLNGISLSEAFPFVVEAAVLSAQKNIRAEGKIRLDLKTNAVTVSDLKCQSELAQLQMAQLAAALPMVKDAPLPDSLKGQLTLTVGTLTAGAAGLGAVTGQVSLAVGEGMITADGTLDAGQAQQNYAVNAQIKNFNLQEFMIQKSAPVKAEGIISGTMTAKGAGFTPEAIKTNLTGNADIAVTRARLKDINVLKAVLDKITILPGLAQQVQASLPEKYRQKFSQSDTSFLDMKLPVIIEKGRIVLRETVLGAEEFVFQGEGSAGFDGSYGMEGAFLIPADLSAAMTASVSQLQYLLNDQKQILIPLRISGAAAGKVEFKVDADYIARRLLENQAKQQIFRAIDKALGTDQPAASDSGDGQQSGSGEASSTKEAVSQILGNIFKK